MSGHSKWSTIKRKKGKADQERGRIFTRLIKEITVAAREGGSDPETNARLRTAVATAKSANMPADNIKRGILKGTGQLPGVSFESFTYEGYGPGGVALMLEVMTDNKNRIVAEIRNILSKHGGNLGAAGCVSWMFESRGVIIVELDSIDEESLMEIVMDNGADDLTSDSGSFEIVMDPIVLEDLRQALEKKGILIASAEVTMLPQNTTKLEDESDATSLFKIIEQLEDNDDIQKVYSNFDIDEALLEKVAGG